MGTRAFLTQYTQQSYDPPTMWWVLKGSSCNEQMWAQQLSYKGAGVQNCEESSPLFQQYEVMPNVTLSVSSMSQTNKQHCPWINLLWFSLIPLPKKLLLKCLKSYRVNNKKFLPSGLPSCEVRLDSLFKKGLIHYSQVTFRKQDSSEVSRPQQSGCVCWAWASRTSFN